MRVGYICSRFPYPQPTPGYSYGGSVIAAYELASRAATLHDVDIFTTSVGRKREEDRSGRMRIHRYGTTIRMASSSMSIGLMKEPAHHAADLLHVHYDIPPAPFAALKYLRRNDVPSILTYHGDWDESIGSFLRKNIIRRYNKQTQGLLAKFDKIIVPSMTYAKKSPLLQGHLDKIVMIPNGVNAEKLKTPESKDQARVELGLPPGPMILFMGYLEPHKQPDLLIRATAKVRSKLPSVFVVLCGEGTMRKGLEDFASKNNVKAYFPGRVEDRTKALFFKAADIFVMPSKMEMQSISIMEAMAVGRPVIASNVGGIPDFVKNGSTGRLVDGGEDAWANAIVEALSTPHDMELWSKKAQEESERFSWDEIAQATMREYDGLIPR